MRGREELEEGAFVILCIDGNPGIDKSFVVDCVNAGEVNRPAEFIQVPGSGMAVARAVKALGGEAVAAGIVGGHAGRWVAEELDREDIERALVSTTEETRACLSVIDCSVAGLTRFQEDGRPVAAADWAQLQTVVRPLIRLASWVAVWGPPAPGLPKDAYVRLVLQARHEGAKVAIDSGGEELLEALTAGPELVKVEARDAVAPLGGGRAAATAEEALAAARGLRELAAARAEEPVAAGGPAVIVTIDDRGAVAVVDDSRAYGVRTLPPGRYGVGGSQAFFAGLVVALDGGADWARALREGAGAAAANSELPGACVLDGARARELAAHVEVVEL